MRETRTYEEAEPMETHGGGEEYLRRQRSLARLIAITEPHVQEQAQHYSVWPMGLDQRIRNPVERIRAWYMRGQCSVFAAVLHEATGWPICGVYATFGAEGHGGVRHWVCRMPDRLYADARGLRRRARDVVAEYACPHHHDAPVILESTMDDAVTRFRRPAINYDVARREHLRLLLPDLPVHS